jgi:hypothetical protein
MKKTILAILLLLLLLVFIVGCDGELTVEETFSGSEDMPVNKESTSLKKPQLLSPFFKIGDKLSPNLKDYGFGVDKDGNMYKAVPHYNKKSLKLDSISIIKYDLNFDGEVISKSRSDLKIFDGLRRPRLQRISVSDGKIFVFSSYNAKKIVTTVTESEAGTTTTIAEEEGDPKDGYKITIFDLNFEELDSYTMETFPWPDSPEPTLEDGSVIKRKYIGEGQGWETIFYERDGSITKKVHGGLSYGNCAKGYETNLKPPFFNEMSHFAITTKNTYADSLNVEGKLYDILVEFNADCSKKGHWAIERGQVEEGTRTFPKHKNFLLKNGNLYFSYGKDIGVVKNWDEIYQSGLE